MTKTGRVSELTVCPFCGCGCGLYLQSVDGALSGVMPSEHHGVSGGRLCARGWAAHEAPLWGRRLTQPLVRGDGALAPTTWDRAMADAVQRLRALVAAGKPIGVLGSGRATNEENFLAVGLARAALQTGQVDSCLRAPYQDLVTGISQVDPGRDPAAALADIEACEVILLIEGDLALTHPRAAYAILKALQRGARLVTAGPVKTQLSRLAWLHLPFIPGDEAAFAAELHRLAGGLGSAGGSTGAAAAPGLRIPPDALGQVVQSYAAASRAAIIVAPTGATPAGLRALGRALAGLAAAAGHLRRPGSVILPLALRGNTRGALEMGAAPGHFPGPCGLDDAAARSRLARAWGREPTAERGLDVERMIHEVAGLIVLADDPPVSLPSEGNARRALAGLECLIVLDALVTPTVEVAHVALPIASLAETEGTVTNTEGRIQWLRPGAPPPEAARAGWRVLAELGGALGLNEAHASVDQVLGEIRGAVLAYAEAPKREPGCDAAWAWALQALPEVSGQRGAGRPAPSAAPVAEPAAEPADPTAFPMRLARVGAFEWGDDPLVAASPTLRRDHASLRRLFPRGLVEISSADARGLGIREGWDVRLVSHRNAVVVPVRLRDDVEPGTVLVPFAFRDRLAPVLDHQPRVAVKLEKV
jgi:predicted molibdopterin-dependent oxidoreductase YjgC